MSETKVCKVCSKELPIARFYKYGDRGQYRQSKCSFCFSEAYRAKHPPRVKEKEIRPRKVVVHSGARPYYGGYQSTCGTRSGIQFATVENGAILTCKRCQQLSRKR